VTSSESQRAVRIRDSNTCAKMNKAMECQEDTTKMTQALITNMDNGAKNKDVKAN
jgi:hypothetical protein